MATKKKRGRPPGPRKDGVNVRMVLARDVVESADRVAAKYGSRTAAIEALVRKAVEAE